MTEKEFLALAPREQDALVAEKVMGWTLELRKYVWEDPSEFYRSDHADFHDGRCIPITEASGYLRPYTTDISAAWEVVEKMGGYGRSLFEWSEGWIFELVTSDGESVVGQAYTAPLAICIAALKAVGFISGH